MNEFMSLPAGFYQNNKQINNTMYSRHVILVFVVSRQTGTYGRHEITARITLHTGGASPSQSEGINRPSFVNGGQLFRPGRKSDPIYSQRAAVQPVIKPNVWPCI